MKKIVLSMLCAGLFFTACDSKKKQMETNPLLTEWSTPFAVPPFNKIENEHYLPAFEEAMKIHIQEIEAIINNEEEPTFENTIVALDNAGELLGRVAGVFFNLSEANTNEKMQEIQKQLSPLMSKHSDDINMNPRLFEKVKKVYEQKDQLNLNGEQNRLLDKTYKSFVRGGVNLSENDQTRMREINAELSKLEIQFGQNLLAENDGFQLIVENKEDLKGLPESFVQSAEKDGKWIFNLHNPSIIPFLQYAENRDLREKIWTAWVNRANNGNDKDNKNIVSEIAKLRSERAHLLGYNNYADFVLEERMAKTPKAVYDLLGQVWTPALAKAKQELADLQKMMTKDGISGELQAWDWRYYTEKVRKEKYDLNEEELKPYFSLPHVREGIFMVSQKLYGLTFNELKDMPIYHPEVEVWEVKDENDGHVGILYMDYYARGGSKTGGAWCTSFQEQYKKTDGTKVSPIVSVVCNFSRPSEDAPALLTYDEAETFFHEFGHVLHALLGDYTYRGVGDVPRDFVELPSQIMENFCAEPQVMKMFAKHYKTNEIISDELIAKISNASKFNQGFGTSEYVAASLLDMDYHVLNNVDKIDVAAFEKQNMDKIGLLKQIPPRYRSTYFSHIFDGGYSAGYYSYMW
ncbi:M3 family metallopeptidase, partial [Bacteroidales bacterium OttesenSCG-928-C19]|nr:M3 family metallopeptidase [Bacteroidales bacterium OttesenSCG-928-C19]